MKYLFLFLAILVISCSTEPSDDYKIIVKNFNDVGYAVVLTHSDSTFTYSAVVDTDSTAILKAKKGENTLHYYGGKHTGQTIITLTKDRQSVEFVIPKKD